MDTNDTNDTNETISITIYFVNIFIIIWFTGFLIELIF